MTPEARGPLDTIFILHHSGAGTGLRQVLQPFTEDMPLAHARAVVIALSLLEALSSLPGLEGMGKFQKPGFGSWLRWWHCTEDRGLALTSGRLD